MTPVGAYDAGFVAAFSALSLAANVCGFRHEPSSLFHYSDLTHLCRLDSSTFTLWTDPFLIEGPSGYFLLLPCFTEIHVLNANSADPDQTPRSVASDQSLHCLPMSLLWGARRKWVNLI